MSRKSFLKTLQKDEEFSKEMKEKFYQIKIIEAIEKKALPFFDWEGLPAEIELKILDFKKEIEDSYIPSIIKKQHLTIKSYEEFIWGYRNEHNEKLREITVARSCNLWLILKNMINKEPSSSPASYHRITENKTPSLEEYINYRKEQKEKEKKKKKLEREEKNKSDFKCNDIIYLSCSGSRYIKTEEPPEGHAYKIIGETKTLFKLALIKWTKEQFVGDSFITGILDSEEETKRCIYALDKDSIKLRCRDDTYSVKKNMSKYMYKLESGTDITNYKKAVSQPDDFNINWLFMITYKRRDTESAVVEQRKRFNSCMVSNSNWTDIEVFHGSELKSVSQPWFGRK